MIAKFDRLGRNTAFASKSHGNGGEFIAVDSPTASRLTIHILAAAAEDEALQIASRIKGVLSAAKAWGTVLGACRSHETGSRASQF